MITTMDFYDRARRTAPERVTRSVSALNSHEREIGISNDTELAVYRALKAAPARTEREISERTRLPEVAVRKAMMNLTARGTVRTSTNNLGLSVMKAAR